MHYTLGSRAGMAPVAFMLLVYIDTKVNIEYMGQLVKSILPCVYAILRICCLAYMLSCVHIALSAVAVITGLALWYFRHFA